MITGVGEEYAATPLCDARLPEPLAIPADVGDWLRSCEQRLRLACAALPRPVDVGLHLVILEDSRRELDAIAGPRGAFSLLLQRPLTQLVEGSVPRLAFERLLEGACTRAEQALGTCQEAVRIVERVRALGARYTAVLPLQLAGLTRRHRVSESDASRLRSPRAAVAMSDRITRVERRLAALVQRATGGPSPTELLPDEPATGAELPLAYAEAARLRTSSRQLGAAGPEMREQLVEQLGYLARQQARAGAATAVGPLLDGLLERAVTLARSNLRAWPDAPLWTGAILGANWARFGIRDRFAWRPTRVQQRATGGAESAPAAPPLRVMPLGDDLAFLSHEVNGPVRVWTAAVKLGRSVEAQLSPDDAESENPGILVRDARSLFDGVDGTQTGWYKTVDRCRLRVIAEAQGGWYARVERKGRLEALDAPAWSPTGPRLGFRIQVDTATSPGQPTTAQTVPIVGRDGPKALATFLGFATIEVRTGMPQDARAWFRATTHRWSGAAEAVRRERHLFDLLGRLTPVMVPQHLGVGRLEGARASSPLYRIPIAVCPRDPESFVRSFAADDRAVAALLHSVATVIRAVHFCNHVLGACHAGAFAYTVDWQGASFFPAPQVVLIHAPRATPIGETYSPHVPAGGETTLLYGRLGVPVALRPVEGRVRARPEDDMLGFGAFAADLLMDPLPERGPMEWAELREVVRSTDFRLGGKHSSLANQILSATASEQGLSTLLRFCDRLARSEPTTMAIVEGLFH